MKPMLSKIVFCGLLCVSTCLAQTDWRSRAAALEAEGLFKDAAAVLSSELPKVRYAREQKELQFELDRLERIKKDYPLSQEGLYYELAKSVKNLTRAEFRQWLQEGRFDMRTIDGEQRFMVSSVGNLFWRYPELSPRRLPRRDTRALEKRHWETCVAIKGSAQAEQKPYVLPKRFQAEMIVTAEPNAAPDRETIRAWLPIPRDNAFQGQFELLSASATVLETNPRDSVIRAVVLEKKADRSKPTSFKIEYEYTTHGVWFDLDPAKVKVADINDPVLRQFTREAPHIVFTPEMRALSDQIIGNEANPCLKAKKFYDWIAENIKYSYATEYSTIRNIGEYCRSHGYGDCGQEALLFMTLCRLNGIPARWQSGWSTFPGAKSIHDWSEIYLQPYGWVPVDPYMGIYAMRYANTLTPEQQRDVRDFYFGGLDQYRMIANADHSQPLSPAKLSMRSDDVDFQRGELEWGKHNIYLDKYSYELSVKEIKPARRTVE